MVQFLEFNNQLEELKVSKVENPKPEFKTYTKFTQTSDDVIEPKADEDFIKVTIAPDKSNGKIQFNISNSGIKYLNEYTGEHSREYDITKIKDMGEILIKNNYTWNRERDVIEEYSKIKEDKEFCGD